MKFFIVVPKFIKKIGQHYTFPLGLAYISSSLKANGYDVKCLNLNHHNDAVSDTLYKRMKNNKFDVICTGGLSIHFTKVQEIIKCAHEINPDIISIIGGGIISSDPELIMTSLRPNFGVLGEGEITIVELAKTIESSGNYALVNGIAYFDSTNKLLINPPRSAMTDLDSLPMLDYDGFEINEYLDMQMPNDEHYMYHFDKPRAIPIIASRSCPYHCTFCYHPLGNKYRQRSLDSLFKELDFLIKHYAVNILTIYDELFSASKDRIREFCQRIKPYNIKFLISMRVDGVDLDTLKMLKGSGCFMIGYGLESANETIIKSMKKHITLSQIKTALHLTYESQIAMQGNFIFSDKAETLNTAEDTINYWLKNRKYQINLTALYLYPGTELYTYAIANNIIDDPISFLENGCPPKNISTLNDHKYSQLLGNIYKLRIENPVPAEVLSCKKIKKDALKGDIYDIRVICPHCLEAVKYNNMHQDGNSMFVLGCRIGCKQCNQRFDVLPFNFYTEILQNKIIDNNNNDILSGFNRIAIYGAGRGGGVIYDYCLQKGKKVLYFIDDYKKDKFCGLTILKPTEIDRYPLPELTVFAGIAASFLAGVKEKMKEWKKTKTLLFTRTHSFYDNKPMTKYYIDYYHNKWLPLLKKGVHN